MLNLLSYITEENLYEWLERFRELGPLPGIFLTFLKSFVPPLPTAVIVGVNAAAYGLWPGFLYSWIGLVAGCMTTFLIVRKVASRPYFLRWAERPKVRKSLLWARRNAVSFVFMLSMLPVGPFAIVNTAAAIARMPKLAFFLAVAGGKAVMVLAVSYVGHDLGRFAERPYELLYVAAFLALSFWLSRRVEAYFTRPPA
ncbi:VTT domain-containing protein [Saccharibacillus sp. CPCC 101409]|uniref:TVP38/TMEM64 family protein n=1 Tax=Saccharibacillus sp. CPCC 101409 TaxID=3058041 RepID=UPI002672F7C9|nr:VTT domain-containing protein [Saccharibacillus sp. CPCC 101409]MDO3410076.1 VTT domain-containing protein [Saccharibacillus sp. CPCC 101409]